MTTIQPADGVHITVNPTDLTTDGQRALQHRINMFAAELARLNGVITQNSVDYMALLRDHEAEKEVRANLQFKCAQYRALLQRVVEVDEACTGDAYAALIAGVKSALAVQ